MNDKDHLVGQLTTPVPKSTCEMVTVSPAKWIWLLMLIFCQSSEIFKLNSCQLTAAKETMKLHPKSYLILSRCWLTLESYLIVNLDKLKSKLWFITGAKRLWGLTFLPINLTFAKLKHALSVHRAVWFNQFKRNYIFNIFYRALPYFDIKFIGKNLNGPGLPVGGPLGLLDFVLCDYDTQAMWPRQRW